MQSVKRIHGELFVGADSTIATVGAPRGKGMPVTKPLALKTLTLDTKNYRTVKQATESLAIQALIAVEPEWFWALMESLVDDGYLPTENIIVLKQGRKYVVKEGNRRVAALKIIFGLTKDQFDPPNDLIEKIRTLPKSWRSNNAKVPCTIFDASEASAADRIVTLTHGKGEKAGRVKWSAVARARHNRDVSRTPEPALDLLEGFLAKGKNVTQNQIERWAGDYPISVLDEAIKKIATRIGAKSAPELAKLYPKVANRQGLEDLMFDIGLKHVGFKEVRADSFGTKYGMPPPSSSQAATANAGGASHATGGTASGTASSGTSQSGSTGTSTASSATGGAASKGATAHPANDPRAVTALLRKFKPKGAGRSKLATLLDELKRLDVGATPHAFCFVLRSMFEISAKAYCDDHASTGGPRYLTSNGRDRNLVDVLKDVVAHLTANQKNAAMTRVLHGAITELADPASMLSVTSLNQLIHNPRFVATSTNICSLFYNVFPLLEQMN